MALVELQRVTKVYDSAAFPVRALDDVDFAIEEGEFVALMGPSGSGKSTMLSVLGAMTPPTSGRVQVDDVDVYDLGSERLTDFRREYLGFVFQSLYLIPHLTAGQNVMLPLAAAALPDARQREEAEAALACVGLDDKWARLPRDLSGGEQQRVAIARAIVNRPALLLADEPTGCLDSATGLGIMGTFRQLQDTGLTVFMVTHDAAMAARADRVVTLKDGRLNGSTGVYGLR